jgi:hypothetical protein
MKPAKTSATLLSGPGLLATLFMNLAYTYLALTAIGVLARAEKNNPIAGQQSLLGSGGPARAISTLALGILAGATKYVVGEYAKTGKSFLDVGFYGTKSFLSIVKGKDEYEYPENHPPLIPTTTSPSTSFHPHNSDPAEALHTPEISSTAKIGKAV